MIDLTQVPNTEIVAAVMESVLESINAVYEQEDVVLPERQYITMGETAHDCEQLTVGFDQMYVGTPGDQAETPQQCNAARTIAMTVQLVRPIPALSGRGATAPSAEALHASARRQATDVWLLLEGCMASPAVEAFGALGDVAVTPPSGAYQAVVVSLVVGVP